MTKVAGAAADGFKNLHKVQKRPVWWFLGLVKWKRRRQAVSRPDLSVVLGLRQRSILTKTTDDR